MSHKRPKNKRKEDKKFAQKAKSLQKRKEIYNEIFKIFNIEEKIRQMPNRIREKIYNFSYPQMQIIIDEIKNLPFAKQTQDQIKDLLFERKIKINESEFPIIHFHYVLAFSDLVKGWYADTKSFLQEKDGREKDKKEASVMLDVLNFVNSKIYLKDIYHDYLNEICDVVAKISLVHFNFENGIYPQLKIKRNESKKSYPAIYLKKLNIKKTQLTLENKSRSAYPLVHFSFKELTPLFFEKNTIDNEHVLPIYVQDHALGRMLERIKIVPLGYLHDCIGRSLADPKVVGMDGSSYLVEFHLYSIKIGYLLVAKTSNFALIRSFKFLTMTGTPEFNELSKTLRATKYDISYLGLDNLETLVNSDIHKDEELRKIFSRCGLEDLFKLSEIKNIFETPKISVAQEIKDYFKF
jgi:hypothetical protein